MSPAQEPRPPATDAKRARPGAWVFWYCSVAAALALTPVRETPRRELFGGIGQGLAAALGGLAAACALATLAVLSLKAAQRRDSRAALAAVLAAAGPALAAVVGRLGDVAMSEVGVPTVWEPGQSAPVWVTPWITLSVALGIHAVRRAHRGGDAASLARVRSPLLAAAALLALASTGLAVWRRPGDRLADPRDVPVESPVTSQGASCGCGLATEDALPCATLPPDIGGALYFRTYFERHESLSDITTCSIGWGPTSPRRTAQGFPAFGAASEPSSHTETINGPCPAVIALHGNGLVELHTGGQRWILLRDRGVWSLDIIGRLGLYPGCGAALALSVTALALSLASRRRERRHDLAGFVDAEHCPDGALHVRSLGVTLPYRPRTALVPAPVIVRLSHFVAAQAPFREMNAAHVAEVRPGSLAQHRADSESRRRVDRYASAVLGVLSLGASASVIVLGLLPRGA